MHLISGRAHAAQVYPRKFCSALCEGIAAQRKLDELGLVARPLMSAQRGEERAQLRGRQQVRRLRDIHDSLRRETPQHAFRR